MSKLQSMWTLGMLALALSTAWAQDSSTPPPSEPAPQTNPQEPTPAYGQENAPPPVSENPPLSGLDIPSLEPHSAPISYIQPGATFNESADTNAGNIAGGSGFTSVSRALGSLTLKRLWSNYDLGLDYVGGVGYYSLNGQGLKLLQQMDIDQKVTWKRGQLSVRDSFSYLPEGNFGGAYGSLGSQGIGSLGSTSFGMFANGNSLSTLGLAPRILNVSIADISENLTPKSAITAAGGYAFTHFYGNDVATGGAFIGSSQTSGQVGYNRILSAHTQIALVYGYQGFDFNFAGMAFHSHIVQGMYGRRISGRMDLLLGAGPQFTRINSQSAVCSDPTLPPSILCLLSGDTIIPITVKNTKIGVAAQARLRYKFTKTSVDLSYQRFETSGSGLFFGSQSDIVRLSATRPLSRVWGAFGDIGYAHNDRLQNLSPAQQATCVEPGQTNPNGLPPCPGIDATTANYGFVGAGLHRAFGREFHGFVSFQFNELSFDHSYCVPGIPCNRISNRNVITFGLDWTPRPIRID
ncbi:MAG: hypothetical protein DMG79_04290 [Acidobacteria bacterium]|nr:MAG: hypothetical protein DMG79_04290 [Acidobacteriota bacterium]